MSAQVWSRVQPIFLHLQTSWPTVWIRILTSTTGSYRDRFCPERGGLTVSCLTAYNWVKKSIHFSQKTESSNCGLRLHSSIQRYCNKTGMLISIRILCLLLHWFRSHIGKRHDYHSPSPNNHQCLRKETWKKQSYC